MKFREHEQLQPVVLTAYSSNYMEEQIAELGRRCDVIDLQFSTTTTLGGDIHYSALALVCKKVKEKK